MNDPQKLARRERLIWDLYLGGYSLQEIAEVVSAVTKSPVGKVRIHAILKKKKEENKSTLVIEPVE